MKYDVGNIVVLSSGETVYITGYEEKSRKYKGFDIEDNNSQEEIYFSESNVIMTV